MNEIVFIDIFLVSFDFLDFEFGERFSERFFNWIFCELLDCYVVLVVKDIVIVLVFVL